MARGLHSMWYIGPFFAAQLQKKKAMHSYWQVNCNFNLKGNFQFFILNHLAIFLSNEHTKIHQAAFSIDRHKVKALVAIVTLIGGLCRGQDKQGGSCFVPLHLDIISLEEALVSQGSLGTPKVWVFVNSYKRWLAL